MNRNIPLSIDDELIAEIDRIAESTKESRSAVMRRAIREGLPLVEAGGGVDVIKLDSETSNDVDTTSKETGVSRAKVLIETIRAGIQATYYRLMRDKWIRAQDKNPKDQEAEMTMRMLEESLMREDPMSCELRTAMRQRGAAITRFHDLLIHVPEAWYRYKLVERLMELRKNFFPIWGKGLSTAEIEWQVAMKEKYGADATLPEEEIKAHDEARRVEDRTHRNTVEDILFNRPFPEK